jgi:hypothetical protein
MTTSCPFKARSAAHVNPDGPDPTIATLVFNLWDGLVSTLLTLSATYLSRAPMEIASG